MKMSRNRYLRSRRIAWVVEVSAALVLAASCFGADAESKTDKLVELPPFLVLEDKRKAAKPWRYVATPGHEILSRSSDDITVDFAERALRLEELVSLIVPKQFQFRTDVPKVSILTSPAEVSANARDVVVGTEGDQRAKRRSQDAGIRFLPNLGLDDVDAVTIFAIIDETRVDASTLVYTPYQVRFMVDRATPHPPAWVVAGIIRLFDDLDFRDREIMVRPFSALTDRDVDGLKSNPDFPRAVVAMEDVFEKLSAAATSIDRGNFTPLSAQAALFVRWSLDGNDPSRQDCFWKLVVAATKAPITDATVRECFGFGLAELRDRLSDYLPVAVANRFQLRPEKLEPVPKLVMRDATPQEVGRIVGDWDRLEVGYVQDNHPEFAPAYQRLAHNALDEARRIAPNDPGLCAIVGLLECDAKNDVMAQPFLQFAADAKVVRPRVYLELARLRYKQALEHPAGSQGRLSALQANAVLALLATAHKQQPPIADVYVLTAEVWNHSQAVLDARNLTMMERAADLFPDDVRLLYLLAVLEAESGVPEKALAVIDRGIRVSRSEAIRTRFKQLKETLAAKQPQ